MAVAISDPAIARMLADCTVPLSLDTAQRWLAQAERDRIHGRAFVWVVTFDDHFVGMVSLDHMAERVWQLGYWLRVSAWGCGFAEEAARAVCGFAWQHLEAEALRAGCFHDNPASEHILGKLGFRFEGSDYLWCAQRRERVPHRWYRLERPLTPTFGDAL
jgi:RimJ/RimL family protein N-acetyltransferase